MPGHNGSRDNPLNPSEAQKDRPLAQRRPKDPERWLPPKGRPPRLLIVRLSALGDVLHALPVLSALRNRFPEARIDWVVEDRAADLLRGRKDLDRVVAFPRQRLSTALRGLPHPLELARVGRSFVRELRAGDYDVALDLQGNLKSGAVLRASGATLRFGLDRPAAREGSHFFSQRRALPPTDRPHRVQRNLALASALLGEDLPYVSPGFPTAATDRAAADRLRTTAGLNGDYVVLHPGTSEFGAFKRWPAERFGALARKLGADGRSVIVTSGPGEQELVQRVVEGSGGRAQALPTPSLLVLAEVIRGAAGFVSGDTGPLHLAALLGTPLLGLFGPKDPEIYGPYGRRVDGTAGLLDVLTREDVACRPCRLRRCGDPLCMNTLEPERVYAALRGVMAAGRAAMT